MLVIKVDTHIIKTFPLGNQKFKSVKFQIAVSVLQYFVTISQFMLLETNQTMI